MRTKTITFTVSLILFLFFIHSCAYFDIQSRDNFDKEELTRDLGETETSIYNSSIIMGKVVCKKGEDYPVAVIAYPLSFQSKNIVDYIILNEVGSFMIYVPEGRYVIYAVCDMDNDSIFETDEVTGIYNGGKEILVENGVIKKDVDITVSKNNAGKIEFPRELAIEDDFNTPTYTGGNGQIKKIYDEMFSPDKAASGWWTPSSFMKEYGANIYFMEPYDSGKIPVLFIHGAKGSPQDWVYFLIRLDRNRYQPWFFYYPSGMRLSLSSKILYEKLKELQKQYGFTTMCITAHSMGGIVVRAMLTDHNFSKNTHFVKLYISLATPWTGYMSADTGMAYSFKKLPSWYDLGRTSSFIKRVVGIKLPPHVSYYLFYGKKDQVSKGTAIDERVFSEAKEHVGFPCDHQTILSDRDVFDQYNEILNKEL
jgi:hypothetical protein